MVVQFFNIANPNTLVTINNPKSLKLALAKYQAIQMLKLVPVK